MLLQRCLWAISILFYTFSSPSLALEHFDRADKIAKLETETDINLRESASRYSKEIDASGQIYEHHELTTLLQNQLDTIYPELKPWLKIKIINDPTSNAFMLPNGSVYINLGMLARSQQPEEVALILAHEASHFIARHSVAEKKSLDSWSVVGLFTAPLLLPTLLIKAGLAGYDRDNESQADEMGLKKLLSQRIDPNKAIRIFEIMEEESRLLDKEKASIYRSHPFMIERITSLKNLLNQQPSTPLPFENVATPVDLPPNIFDASKFQKLIASTYKDWLDLSLASGEYQSLIYLLKREDFKSRLGNLAPLYLAQALKKRNYDNDLDESITLLKEVVKNNSNETVAYRLLGEIYYKKKQFDEAKNAFNQFIEKEKNPDQIAYAKVYLDQIK